MYLKNVKHIADSLEKCWKANHVSEFPAFLRRERPIRLIGMGASYNVSVAAAAVFNKYGIRAQASRASEFLHFELSAELPDECFIMISQSGESVETVKVAARLKERGSVYTIAVTNNAQNTLTSLTSATCLMQSDKDALISVMTYNASFIVLYKMALALSGTALPDLKNVYDAAKRLALESESFAISLIQEIPNPRTIDFLGRGPSFGSALEASIIMREVAKIPTSAWEIGDYRHGAQESMKEDQLSVVFAGSRTSLAQLDVQVAHQLRTFAGKVLCIGLHGSDIDIGVANEDMRPVLDMIPIYYLAYHWAVKHDVVPGTFKWAAHVTKEEV